MGSDPPIPALSAFSRAAVESFEQRCGRLRLPSCLGIDQDLRARPARLPFFGPERGLGTPACLRLSFTSRPAGFRRSTFRLDSGVVLLIGRLMRLKKSLKVKGETVKKLSWQRHLTSIILALSFSCAALGGDGRTAGTVSREITTLFPGDSIEATEDSVANITSDRSSVLVMPNASVKFMGNDVELSEGGVSIATSEGMTVSVDGLIISPAAQQQSKFEVVESDAWQGGPRWR